jgi:hypothetical protein
VSDRKPTSPSDDEAPDAWLKGALLHAPDAQADAPPALTHNILREARLALEGEARAKLLAVKHEPTRRSHWLTAAWNQFTRPQVAAGFASVMVATVAGLLWWDKPLDERGDPPMTAAAPSPQAAAVPASAADSVALSMPSRRVVPEAAQDKAVSAARAEALAKPAAESTARAKLADASRLEESRRQARKESAQADTVVAEAAGATPTPAPAPPAAATPAPAAAPAAAMAAAPAPSPEIASTKASRDESAAFTNPPQNRSAAMQSAQRAEPATAPATAPAAAATGNALTTQPASPFSRLLTAVAASPEQWRWQADGGTPQAVTPALQNWLQLLDQSAGSRWISSGSTGEASGRADNASGAPGLNFRLNTGSSSARIALAGNAVTLQRGGALWTVVLAPQAADVLRKAWADTPR